LRRGDGLFPAEAILAGFDGEMTYVIWRSHFIISAGLNEAEAIQVKEAEGDERRELMLPLKMLAYC
jgi:hypothetical protein